MTPFDFINSINNGKDIMVDEATENAYVPFVVNRGLSYFADTIMYANELNKVVNTDKKLQYHYLINTIVPRKRFSKWAKKHEDSDIELVMNNYNYSYEKAAQVLSLLTKRQLEELKNKNNKGGIR
jgi:predicted transcriptional regulator